MILDSMTGVFLCLQANTGNGAGRYNPRMRRRDWIAASMALGLAGERAAGQQSAEARKAFLDKFPWTELCTTAEDAMLLRILIESRRAKYGVEVGGNVGYGALHMGIGFERSGGRLVSVEIDPANVRTARKNLEAVGIGKAVTVVEGDALKVLPTLEAGIDFLFIDALKRDYLKYFQCVEAKLVTGATVVADNVIASARAMADFLTYVQGSPKYDSVVIRASMHKNDGMLVAYRL
jgi:predicted O-methyltransferase YrrM